MHLSKASPQIQAIEHVKRWDQCGNNVTESGGAFRAAFPFHSVIADEPVHKEHDKEIGKERRRNQLKKRVHLHIGKVAL
jgi:hypothetical protein